MEMKENNDRGEINTLLDEEKGKPLNKKEKSTGKDKTVVSRIHSFFVDSNGVDEPEISETGEQRIRWDNYMEYFLSIIGFVIDLGNVWRFPTVCYMNGGGAFLIPFFICLFLIGMPCMYLELAIGQYFQLGNISIWAKLSPYMKGIGLSVILVNILMLSYYNTLQAYELYFLVNSMSFTVPWNSCDQPWSTPLCHKSVNMTMSSNDNSTGVYLASSEFFRRKVLYSHLSNGFEDLGGIKFDLLLCLLFIFSITTLCLVKGIKTSGKAVYFTALLPYVCLIVLIAQSLTLDGSLTGLKYYLKPNFSKLLEPEVWLAAAVQIFFSLGPGFGVLITYASYTTKTTKIKNVTLSCAVVNLVTSFMYGLVVFSGLGYMAKRLNVEIEHFLEDGIGLVFIVYPEILATFKFPQLFAFVFFFMLILLGMDSAFGGMEGLYTAIIDEYPLCKRHPFITRIAISLVPFLTALPSVSYGGVFVVQWLDRFAISPAIIIVVTLEIITVCWIYGSDRYYNNIKSMSGSYPGLYWKITWKYICPLLLASIVISEFVLFAPLEYGSYKFPMWSNWVGYSMNFFLLLPIPMYALYKLAYPSYLARRQT